MGEEKCQVMPAASQHKQDLQDGLPSMWSTGRFTERNECQGEICKWFLTVNVIQRSDLLTEVPLKTKEGGKGKYLRRNAFTAFLPIFTSVAFWPEGI